MKKRRRSLVWKLSIFTTIMIGVLIVVVCVVYLQTFTISAREEAKGQSEQARQKAERNIYGNLKDAEAFLNDLFYKQEFPYFMNAKNTLSQSEINYYVSSLQSALTNGRYLYNNMFGNFCVYSSNRQIGEKGIFYFLDTLKEKNYYKEIRDSADDLVFGRARQMDIALAGSVTDRFNMGDSDGRILPVYKKVYDLNTKEVIGVVEIDLDVARISDSTGLESVKGRKGVLILDDDGSILVDTLQGSKELNAVVKKALSHKTDSGKGGGPVNKQGENKQGQNKQGQNKLSCEGNQYMMSSHRLKDIHLTTVSVISLDDLQAYLRTRVIQVCAVCLVCLLFMFAMIHYFVHSMLKRLVILDSMMAKVGEGNFGIVIDGDKVEDEVTRITQSFNGMSMRLNKVMEEKVEYEQSLKEAELRALQAQINPHFLYNTLENMRMQCEIDEYYTLGDSLSALGELFRYSISWGTDEVCFEAEWKNLENYISIMEMRYGESLDFVLKKDDNLDGAVVPKLIIQPLVENCFNHGFKNKIPPWEIKILAKAKQDALVLIIADNGNGIPPERLALIQRGLKENRPFRDEQRQKNSIGLTNVSQRIRLICRPGSTMTIESEVGKGTEVVVVIGR